MSKVPAIRFNQFSEDWKADTLSANTERIVRKNDHLESTLPLTISAQYGLIAQNKFFNSKIASSNLRGYYLVNNGEFAYNKSSSQDYPFGAIKRLDEHKQGVLSTLYIVFSLAPEINSDYMVSYFASPKWHMEVRKKACEGARNHGLLNISAQDFLSMGYYLPSSDDEQEKIGCFFKNLDVLIKRTMDELDKLKNLKQACLQSMFPQDGESTPRVRFKGFNSEWKESSLGDCFDESNARSGDGELLSVTIGDGIKPFSELNRHDNSSKNKANYKCVRPGYIAYNSMRMWQGASGCSEFEGIVSPAYTVVIPKAGIDPCFFACYFKNESLIRKFRINSQGLTSDTWNLKYPAFSKIKLTYPTDTDEQRLIAAFFDNLNRQISLQKQELDRLKHIKTACLDKMFVMP